MVTTGGVPLTVTSGTVEVDQALTSLAVVPSTASLAVSSSLPIWVNEFDQFHQMIIGQTTLEWAIIGGGVTRPQATPTSLTWTVSGGGGTASGGGNNPEIVLKSGATAGGPYTLTATAAGVPAAILTYQQVAASTVPAAPTTITQTGSTATSVSLSWSPSLDSSGHAVTSYLVMSSLFPTVATSTTTATVGGLLPYVSGNGGYPLNVVAVDSSGRCSLPSATFTAVTSTMPVPPSPSGLAVAQLTATTASIVWNAQPPIDGQFIIFSLYYGQPGNSTYPTNPMLLPSMQLTGLSPSTTYNYQLYAWDEAGSSTPTSFSFTTPALPSVPPLPLAQGFHVSATTSTGITVAWPMYSTDAGVKLAYTISYTGPQGPVVVATASPYTITGLIPKTTYPITLSTIYGGSTVATATISATTSPSLALPPIPVLLSETGSTDSSVALTWSVDPGSPDGSAAVSFELGIGGSVVATASTTSGTISSLHAQTAYQIAVRSVDIAGNRSPWSLPLSAITGIDATPPSIPTKLAASGVTMTQASISWAASSDNVAVTGYKIIRDTLTVVGSVSGLTVTDTGLQPNTLYSYTVSAYDAAGNISAPSQPLLVVTAADAIAPSVPAGLHVVSAAPAQIVIAWTASTDPTSAVASYQIERQDVAADIILLGSSTSPTFTDVTVSADSRYLYAVSAINTSGLASAWSPWCSATTSPPVTVAQAATASPASVTGTTTALSVLGADAEGESTLTYLWSVIGSASGQVQFTPNGSNAAKLSTALFSQPGSYTLRVAIQDLGSDIVTSQVAVTVVSTAASLSLVPSSAVIKASGTQAFSASVLNQFGQVMSSPPATTWSISSTTSGTINSSTGLFTGNATTGGPYVVTATNGTIKAPANLTIHAGTTAAPTLATPAAATLGSDGKTVSFSILGADAAGESSLTYLWSVLSSPAGGTPVISPASASNAAKAATTVVTVAGQYRFRCVITDAAGLSTASDAGLYLIGRQPPVVTTAPTALPIGTAPTTVQLAVAASDPASVTYTWAAVLPSPAPVSFDPSNGTAAASSLPATLTAAGTYIFQVTITDANQLSTMTTVTITVPQIASGLIVLPPGPTLVAGTSLNLSAEVVDQFSTPMQSATAVTWSGNGLTVTNGTVAAGTVPGDYSVMATSGSHSAGTDVYVVAPTSFTLDPSSYTEAISVGGVTNYYTHQGSVLLQLTRPPGDPSTLSVLVGGEDAAEVPPGVLSVSVPVLSGSQSILIIPSGTDVGDNLPGVQVVMLPAPPSLDFQLFTQLASADQTLITNAQEIDLNGNPDTGTWSNSLIRTQEGKPAYSASLLLGQAASTCEIDAVVPLVVGSLAVTLTPTDAGTAISCPIQPLTAGDRLHFTFVIPATVADGDYQYTYQAQDAAGNATGVLTYGMLTIRIHQGVPLLAYSYNNTGIAAYNTMGTVATTLPAVTGIFLQAPMTGSAPPPPGGLGGPTLPGGPTFNTNPLLPLARGYQLVGSNALPLAPSVRQGGGFGRFVLPSPVAVPGSVQLVGEDSYGNFTTPMTITTGNSYAIKTYAGINDQGDPPLTPAQIIQEGEQVIDFGTFIPFLGLATVTFGSNPPYTIINMAFANNFATWTDGRTVISTNGTAPYNLDGVLFGDGGLPVPVVSHGGTPYTIGSGGWWGHRDNYAIGNTAQITWIYQGIVMPGLPGGGGTTFSNESGRSSYTFGQQPTSALPPLRGLSYMQSTDLNSAIPSTSPSYFTPNIAARTLTPTAGGKPTIYPLIVDIPPSWSAAATTHHLVVSEAGVSQFEGAMAVSSYSGTLYAGSYGANAVTAPGTALAGYTPGTGGVAFDFPVARTSTQSANPALYSPGAVDLNYTLSGTSPRQLSWTNDGDRWLRAVEILDDAISVGQTQHIRIQAGFLASGFTPASFSATGDYVHFMSAGTSLTINQTAGNATNDETKINVLSQTFTPDPVEPLRIQTLDLEVYVGSQLPLRTMDVDLNLGAITGMSDPLSAPNNGSTVGGAVSHRMLASLTVARFIVHTLALQQLQDQICSIHINDGYDGQSDPNCWIDAQLPQYSKTQLTSLMGALSLGWGLAPHVYLFQAGTGPFKTYPATGLLPTDPTVRMLGGRMYDSAQDALIGGNSACYYYTISGPLLDQLGYTAPLAPYIKVSKLLFQSTAYSEASGRFLPSPWGSPSLYGNSALISLKPGQATSPILQPANAIPGFNLPGFGSNVTFAVTSDQPNQDGSGAPANLVSWAGPSSFVVVGQQPGITMIQVRPLYAAAGYPNGQVGGDILLNIPIIVDLPETAEPGLDQLDVARQNAALRQSWVHGGSTGPLTQIDTPVPPNGTDPPNPLFGPPPSYQWITGTAGSQLTFLPWSMQTTQSAMYDGEFDLAMHYLAQIVPINQTPVSTSDVNEPYEHWYSPLTSNISFFGDPLHTPSDTTTQLILSIDQITNIWLWGSPGTNPEQSIITRFQSEAMPMGLWQRAAQLPTYAAGGRSYATRAANDAFSADMKLLTECKMHSYDDLATIARLSRYFSLQYDYLNPTTSVPTVDGTDPVLGQYYTPLPMLGPGAVVTPLNLWDQIQGLWGYGPIQKIFNTPLTPSWQVGNPLTISVINAMILERNLAARQIIASWEAGTLKAGTAGWPITTATSSAIPLLYASDPSSGNLVFSLPGSALNANVLGGYWAFTDGSQNLFIQTTASTAYAANSSGLVLADYAQPEIDGVPTLVSQTTGIKALNAQAAMVIRLTYEADLLTAMLSNQAQESFWQLVANNRPISYWAVMAGDAVWSPGSIYNFVTGTNWQTGKALDTEGKVMNGALALLSILPMATEFVGAVKGAVAPALNATIENAGKNELAALAPNMTTTGAVNKTVAAGTTELAQGGKAVLTTTLAQVGNSLASSGITGLTQTAFTRITSASKWFEMHAGVGAAGPGWAVRAGSQAPGSVCFRDLANGAVNDLPDSALGAIFTQKVAQDAVAAAKDAALPEVQAAFAAGGDQLIADVATQVCKGGSCFPAGTRVLMSDGTAKRIEDIREGDRIQSRADHGVDRPALLGEVVSVTLRSVTELVELAVKGPDGRMADIAASGEHPFWRNGATIGWTPADHLMVGDGLVGPGQDEWIIASARIATHPSMAVYSLLVSPAHTYYVTGASETGPPCWVWVHNSGCPIKDLLQSINASINAGIAVTPQQLIPFLQACSAKCATKASDIAMANIASIGAGSSTALRASIAKMLGITFPKGLAAHHIIPVEVAQVQVDFLRKIGFLLDAHPNGMMLPKSVVDAFEDIAAHAGSHQGYSQAVETALARVAGKYGPQLDRIPVSSPGWLALADAARAEVSGLQNLCRDQLAKGTSIIGKEATLKAEWSTILSGVGVP